MTRVSAADDNDDEERRRLEKILARYSGSKTRLAEMLGLRSASRRYDLRGLPPVYARAAYVQSFRRQPAPYQEGSWHLRFSRFLLRGRGSSER